MNHTRHPPRLKLGVLVGLLVLAQAGCFGSIGEPRRRYFTLNVDKLRARKEKKAPLGGLLRVRDLDSDSLYDRLQMVQRQSPYELSFGAHEVWAVKPGRMLADVVANALQQTQLFDGVTRELGERRPTFLLAGGIRALEVKTVEHHVLAHLAFDLEVTRFSDNQVVWAFRYDREAPVFRVEPGLIVQTLSTLLTQAMAQAADELTALGEAPLVSPHVAP